jgi:hypothetical protein
VGPQIYRPGSTGALPDLSVSQMKFEYQNPSCLLQGDPFGLRVWVTNSGQAAAGTFNVKAGDAQQTVTGLAVGETKAVFFSGYSSQTGAATTVTVDPNNAVAESNEQNNSRTETVAVPTQPLPCTATPTSTPGATATSTPTGTVAPPSATPTVTATSTSTGSTTLYQNSKYNFKFSLPSGASILSQSDTLGRVSLPIVTAGTNLLEKYIQINVVEGANPCISPAVDGMPTSTENVTINSIAFVKTTGEGAAAGNRYDWTVYATTDNTACITLAFILHSANPGNYPTPPPVYDSAAESAVIGTTMATYNKISS